VRGEARYKRSPKDERTFQGKVYDSKREAAHAAGLHALARSGMISDLQEQVPFVICPKQGKGERDMTYRADFVYRENGETVVEDVKGHRTQLYNLKKRLMKFMHGITIREV
jgi:hypothetical protein